MRSSRGLLIQPVSGLTVCYGRARGLDIKDASVFIGFDWRLIGLYSP